MLRLSNKQAAQLTGQRIGRSDSRKPGERQQDKAGEFLHWWRIYAPGAVQPLREYKFHCDRKWRFDFAFPTRHLIAVEIDGGQFTARGGRHNTDADREKMNAAVSLGWRVFRFSPQQLEADPAGCVALVRKALEETV